MAFMSLGINPLTEKRAKPDDCISSKEVQDCCKYVMEVIDSIIGNPKPSKYQQSVKPQKKKFFNLPYNEAEYVEVTDEGITAAELASRINEHNIGTKKISATRIIAWLADKGLIDSDKVDGKVVYSANDMSGSLGIIFEFEINGKYRILFNRYAQRFIISNANQIMR